MFSVEVCACVVGYIMLRYFLMLDNLISTQNVEKRRFSGQAFVEGEDG